MPHFLGLLKLKEKSKWTGNMGTRWDVRKNAGRERGMPFSLGFSHGAPFQTRQPLFNGPHTPHIRTDCQLGRPQPVLLENPGHMPAHSSQAEGRVQSGLVSTGPSARVPVCGQGLGSPPGVCGRPAHHRAQAELLSNPPPPLQPHVPGDALEEKPHPLQGSFTDSFLRKSGFQGDMVSLEQGSQVCPSHRQLYRGARAGNKRTQVSFREGPRSPRGCKSLLGCSQGFSFEAHYWNLRLWK